MVFLLISVFLSALLAIFNSGLAADPNLNADPSIRILSHTVDTEIRLHYSQTTVQSRIRNNNAENAVNYVFSTIVPNSAFISDLYIQRNGKIITGALSAKNSANNDVSLWVRNANIVTFQIPVQSLSEINIVLVYNEVLEKRLGMYQQTTYIAPNLIGTAQTLTVRTNIDETKRLKFVRLPFNEQDASVKPISPNNTEIVWIPRIPVIGDGIGSPCSVFQYAVQYDIDNENDGGEIIIIDGFFFHFFVPLNLKPLRKHVIFVLDISGSMLGQKIAQLITAMVQILGDLKPDDFFNMITFESYVQHYLTDAEPIEATASNIELARTFVKGLRALGGTAMYTTFIHTFNLITKIRGNQTLPENVETMVVFLTDGQPTDANTNQIIANVQTQNALQNIPIYSLAFGRGADLAFLDQLARQNFGESKEIFEGSDAAEQLKDFYSEISSPVLTDVRISYESNDFDITGLTITNFTSVGDGAAIKVSGKLTPKIPGVGPFKLTAIVQGQGRDGPVTITKDIFVSPTKSRNIQESSFVQKLWAHIAIQQLIDDYLASGDPASKTASQALAIQNGFVTPYTTLSVTIARCFADIFVELTPIVPPVATNCSTASFP